MEVQVLFRPLKIYAGVAQLVERNLAKVDVTGSNPASRSLILFNCVYPTQSLIGG